MLRRKGVKKVQGKFRIGDEVKCIERSMRGAGWKLGLQSIIEKITHSDGKVIYWSGFSSDGVYEDELELVTQRFEVGDRVEGDNGYSFDPIVGRVRHIGNSYTDVEILKCKGLTYKGSVWAYRDGTLKLLRKGGGEMKFKVGDSVRVLRDSPECSYWHKGDIFTVTEIMGKNIYGKGIGRTNTNFVYESDIELAYVDEYESLKEEINAIMSWDQKTDDILKKIYNNSGCHYVICIGIAHNYEIKVRESSGAGTVIASFSYHSQCSKLEAFRKAIVCILDKSTIKKSIVGQEKTVEVNGKLYKARILSEEK